MSSRTSRAAAPIRDLLRTSSDKQVPDEFAARLSGMTLECSCLFVFFVFEFAFIGRQSRTEIRWENSR